MYIDAITLAAIADEWRLLLVGARIDKIIQPTEYSIAIQCYAPGTQEQSGQNRWLYLSAHPQLARAHITTFKPAKIGSEPPPFVMLLRKYLEGARIETILQPRWERVLELVAGYRSRSEDDEGRHFRLIIEIMGRMSNIIFCDEEGMILGSLKHIGSDINRYRSILPGIAYVPPPPQQRIVAHRSMPRLEPGSVTAAQLLMCRSESTVAEQSEEAGRKRKHAAEQLKLWQLLTKHLLGYSPLLAREAVYRTTEDAEAPLAQSSPDLWEELAWNIRDLATIYDTHQWHPQLIERVQSGSPARPIAFAPYVLEQYARLPDVFIRESPSLNVLLDEYFARAEWYDAMENVRAPMRKLLQTQRERCQRKAALLQEQLAGSEEAALYRLQGELLLAHQHEVKQGQKSVELPNFFEAEEGSEPPIVTVPLDPRFDAVGNANRLFNKYHKLRRATELIPSQIEQNAIELARIVQLLTDLLLAETPAEVALVKAEVQEAGYIRGKAAKEKKTAKGNKKGKKARQGKGKGTPPGGGVPLQVQSADGFTILIGKNSRQNEDVTFHQATAHDCWLHARGVAGAHVIIKAAGRELPQGTIMQAAKLAAYYSEARQNTSVPVDYTLQRYVRHMKGGGPGMVIYERERTLYAEPEGPAH